VQEIRAQLARVVPLRLAGKAGDAYQLADRAIADARRLPYAPLLAEALLESARAREAEEPAEAAPLFTQALLTAQASRDDTVVAAAAVGLVDAYGHLNQPAEWKLWQDYANAALKRIGGDPELEAELWSAIGQCHHEQGRYADAFAAHEKALGLLQRRFGARDVRTLVEERSALTALNNIGKEEEARDRKLRLLTRTEELLGPSHPAVARMLISVGFSDGVLGHFAEGREVLERAATILRDLGVLDSRRWLSWYDVASDLALRQGRYADAVSISERGLKMQEHLRMGANTLALALMATRELARTRLGHGAEAIAALKDELGRAEISVGANNPALEPLLLTLADSYEAMGRPLQALEMRERHVRLMRARNPEHSGQVIEAELDLSRNLAGLRPAEVLAFDDDQAKLLARSGPQSMTAILVHQVRGEALLKLGRAEPAVEELAAAVRIADAAGYDPNLRARLRGWLARARYAIDPRSPAAAELVAQAERDYEGAEHVDAMARAQLRSWARAHGLHSLPGKI
jgi:tetratricopeptide (TPR) repeat protein